jgi:hypothetical protein
MYQRELPRIEDPTRNPEGTFDNSSFNSSGDNFNCAACMENGANYLSRRLITDAPPGNSSPVIVPNASTTTPDMLYDTMAHQLPGWHAKIVVYDPSRPGLPVGHNVNIARVVDGDGVDRGKSRLIDFQNRVFPSRAWLDRQYANGWSILYGGLQPGIRMDMLGVFNPQYTRYDTYAAAQQQQIVPFANTTGPLTSARRYGPVEMNILAEEVHQSLQAFGPVRLSYFPNQNPEIAYVSSQQSGQIVAVNIQNYLTDYDRLLAPGVSARLSAYYTQFQPPLLTNQPTRNTWDAAYSTAQSQHRGNTEANAAATYTGTTEAEWNQAATEGLVVGLASPETIQAQPPHAYTPQPSQQLHSAFAVQSPTGSQPATSVALQASSSQAAGQQPGAPSSTPVQSQGTRETVGQTRAPLMPNLPPPRPSRLGQFLACLPCPKIPNLRSRSRQA